MNINEYRQGLMDLAGSGMDFHHVFHKVQDAVSTIRLVESKGKDVEWLKEFYEFAMEEMKRDMARGRNHFDRFAGGEGKPVQAGQVGSVATGVGTRAPLRMDQIPRCPECGRHLDLVNLLSMTGCGRERDELRREGKFTLLICGGQDEKGERVGCGWYGDENFQYGVMSGLTVQEQIERIRGKEAGACG